MGSEREDRAEEENGVLQDENEALEGQNEALEGQNEILEDDAVVLEVEIVRLTRILRRYKYSLLYIGVMVTIMVIVQTFILLR